jgi:hypothetical protein
MVNEIESLSVLKNSLFLHIFRSFRMAIQPSRLAVAFAALTVICLAGWLMDLSRTVVVSAPGEVALPGGILGRWPRGEITEFDAYLRSPAEFQALLNSPASSHARTGVFDTLAAHAAAQIQTTTTSLLTLDIRQFILSLVDGVQRSARALIWAFRYHTIYSMAFFAVVLATLAVAGGTICRLGALQFARGERQRLSLACRFATRRLASLVIIPVGPLILAFVLGLPILLLGLVGNIPVVGEILTGLLLPLALVLAPFIAVVLIGEAAGLGLMYPAIAYEDSDFFDAVGRSFSSVYARPWRLGFYTLVAAVYGAACYLFVRFFAFLVLWVTAGFLHMSMGDAKFHAIWPQPGPVGLLGVAVADPQTGSLWLGAFLVRIWILAIAGLTVAFLISFYFTANTVIYALMRNRVDGTGLDEICDAPEEATSAEQPQNVGPRITGGDRVEPTGTTSE